MSDSPWQHQALDQSYWPGKPAPVQASAAADIPILAAPVEDEEPPLRPLGGRRSSFEEAAAQLEERHMRLHRGSKTHVSFLLQAVPWCPAYVSRHWICMHGTLLSGKAWNHRQSS